MTANVSARKKDATVVEICRWPPDVTEEGSDNLKNFIMNRDIDSEDIVQNEEQQQGARRSCRRVLEKLPRSELEVIMPGAWPKNEDGAGGRPGWLVEMVSKGTI